MSLKARGGGEHWGRDYCAYLPAKKNEPSGFEWQAIRPCPRLPHVCSRCEDGAGKDQIALGSRRSGEKGLGLDSPGSGAELAQSGGRA